MSIKESRRFLVRVRSQFTGTAHIVSTWCSASFLTRSIGESTMDNSAATRKYAIQIVERGIGESSESAFVGDYARAKRGNEMHASLNMAYVRS